MSKLIIEGEAHLAGEIVIKGAKNAALNFIPAAILSDKKMTITNFPQIEDIRRALELIRQLGGNVRLEKGVCEIEINLSGSCEIDKDIAGKLRASIIFIGPNMARTGEIRFPAPGGCNLASGAKRPIDLFLDGLAKFGAEIKIVDDYYELKAKKLKACKYFFTTMSVTGTESLMMTAVLADGKTVLKNCAQEPEITALAEYLNSHGAKIKGAGTTTIVVEGVKKINAGQCTLIPDRIETGTFAIMAAATKSEITLTNCNPSHIEILLALFEKQNIPFELGQDWLKIKVPDKIKAGGIKTHEYPGFPTDLQAPYAVLMTQAEGLSLIHETIWDRRLLYSDMLMQMGADIIMCDPHRLVVKGPTKLYGRRLTSPDIRAGIAMILAGLIAQGQTEIDNIYQIDRGYEDIDGRLRSIGANIKRIGTLNL